jgi:hypothetical protein
VSTQWFNLTLDGFSASVLRRSVVEFATPALDQSPISLRPLWHRPRILVPATSRATEVTNIEWIKENGNIIEQTTTEKVDRLLKFVPISEGAKW